jgi:glycosyltransferase involved in cell wall biosynthesis
MRLSALVKERTRPIGGLLSRTSSPQYSCVSKRLKVLISAYACEPGKGSEPEVGWQWALQMARFHDVTVLTRENNRPAIEDALKILSGRQPVPEFVYHDRGRLLLSLKSRFKLVLLYYLLWQRSAHRVIAQLQEERGFDLLHHVTFAGFRYPTATWGHGVPCIWGPVGGIESIPRDLLPYTHLKSLVKEWFRNFHNLILATPFQVLPNRAHYSSLILASTREMQQMFCGLGVDTELMPTIGINPSELPYHPRTQVKKPLRLLFVGNIITLKGVDLAIEALAASGGEASLTFVGSGNFLDSAHSLAGRLGLGDRVIFRGRLPRNEVLQVYRDYDVFILPSLHDTGSYSSVEALFNELPVICLDIGGPAVAVEPGCGVRVPVTSRREVISGLAAAIRDYEQNPSLVVAHGKAGRESVLRNYDWERKGALMNERYERATASASNTSRGAGAASGLGRMRGLFSVSGVSAGVILLLLLGAAGFMSVAHLKRDARRIVRDTMPGLSFAGQASASSAQAFNRTLLMIMAETDAERTEFSREVEEYSNKTTQSLDGYASQIFDARDQDLYDRWLKARMDYLVAREKTLLTLSVKGRADAILECRRNLLPVFTKYQEAGERVMDFNIDQAKVRGRSILEVGTATQIALAAFAVLSFVLGSLFGLFR